MAFVVTAEDDDTIRASVQRSLERAGHEVLATPDGMACLEAVLRRPPDIIVTDVDMPRMTGLDLCRAVRRDPDLRHIPVLVVSGSIDPGDPVTAEAGVTSVLGKPFMPAELRSRLEDLLAGRAGDTSGAR
jgi:CheY-like chemotaxis protein